MSNKGLLFVISAPAGTGKTTLVSRLKNEFPKTLLTSVSLTTRQPRPDEREGIDYHFVTRDQFEKKILENEFLEHVQLYGNYYGTSKKWVEKQLEEGKQLVLTIDTQGAAYLKNLQLYEAAYIFIKPPSLEELRSRLEQRKTETEEVIDERLEWSKQELKAANIYEYLIVNDDLNTAYDALRSIVIAEQHRIRR